MRQALAAAQEASAGVTVVPPVETSTVPTARVSSIWGEVPEMSASIEAERLDALRLSPRVPSVWIATEVEAAALAEKASTPMASPEGERGRARVREPAEVEGVAPPQAASTQPTTPAAQEEDTEMADADVVGGASPRKGH
jgi:hypothetical protein